MSRRSSVFLQPGGRTTGWLRTGAMLPCRRLLAILAAGLGVAAAFLPAPIARHSLRIAGTGRVCGVGRSALRRPTGGLSMRFVAMNKFQVKRGCEEEFETIWRERESKLENFSGFVQFMMLKGDSAASEEEGEGGYTEFISTTIWMHRMDFDEWRKSQAFKSSHGGGDKAAKEGGSAAEGKPVVPGGMSKMGELLIGPPRPALYDAVLVEPTPPEHQGGLFDFEENADYFDGDL